MSDAKDVLLAKALLDSSTANFQRSMDSVVGTERAKIDGESARRQTEQAARNEEINALVRKNAADRARIDGSKLHEANARTLDLESYVESLENELEAMRKTMKEWVASQRGLLALAKALKEESQSCPAHEHHKIANNEAIRDEIANNAARHIEESDMAIKIAKTEIPAYTKRHSSRR
jgi:hypothetical protein